MKVKSLLSIVLGSLTLAACAPEMEEIPAEEQYLRDFIKKYGIIDPNQNWSLASNQVVSVKGASGAEAKIYVELDGQRYIVADYKNIADPAALTFDIPAGMKNVIVKVNGKEFNTTVGSSIDASSVASRTFGTPGGFGDGVGSFKIEEEPHAFSTERTRIFISDLVEDSPNLGKYTSSFYFLADGKEHTFYPIYWNTNAYHIIGIYWLNSDGTFSNDNMVDLYYTKSGELEYSDDYTEEKHEIEYFNIGDSRNYAETTGWSTTEDTSIELKDKDGNVISYTHWGNNIGASWGGAELNVSYTSETAIYYTDHGYISLIRFKGNKFYFTETVTTPFEIRIDIDGVDGNWSKWDPSHNYSYDKEVATGVRAKGITYKLTEGTKYGFYLKRKVGDAISDGNDYDYVLFSHATRNKTYVDKNILSWNQEDRNAIIRKDSWKKFDWWDSDLYSEEEAYAYSCYYLYPNAQNPEWTMFAFEDWYAGEASGSTSPDLNDVVFIFKEGNRPSTVITEENPEPVIPDDPDEPDDQPLTWTLAVEDLGESDDYDFNDLVLEITHVAGTTEATVRALAAGGIMPIYVKYDGNLIAETHVNQWLGHDDHTKMINTGSGATGTHSEAITITVGATDKMDDIINKFTIVVKNGENEDVAKEIHTVTTEVGTTPLMLLLPHAWQWPIERTNIEEAYPTSEAQAGFKAWVGDAEKIDWIKSKQEEKVYK